MKKYSDISLARFLEQTDYLYYLHNEIREEIEYQATRDGETANFNKPFYREKLESEVKNTIKRAFSAYGIYL
jgi:hypothetical protein